MEEKVYFAQKGFILHGGKLLAVRKGTHAALHPGKWEVPGGRLMPGESLGEHLLREIHEETGLHAEAVEPFYLWDWPLGADRVVAVAVLCRTEQWDVTLAGQVTGDDLAEIAWIPLDQLTQLEWIPNMLPVIHRFLEKYGRA